MWFSRRDDTGSERPARQSFLRQGGRKSDAKEVGCSPCISKLNGQAPAENRTINIIKEDEAHMRIANNIMALNAHRQLVINQNNIAKSIEKLSSGLRINRAGDDAAGLAISEKMRAQIRGLNQAIRNAQDGISLIQTAEGALQETHAILQRMRELAVQAANDTYTEEDRAEIQKEIDQLAAELTRIADTTEFNTQNLLGGGFSGTFHIGANEGQKIVLDINDMSAEALKVARTVELTQTTTTVHGVGGQTVLQDP